jgi:DNA-binding transcriptional LysR family regulator
MQLRQLEYIDAIIRWGTIREAARQLYISEASISQQIRELEEETRLQLFERKSHHLKLTPEGHELLPSIRQVLYSMQELQKNILEMRDVAGGTVRLGAVPSSAARLIPAVVTSFHTVFPTVSLEVHERGTYELVEQVRSGVLDIAFIVQSGKVIPDFSGLTVEPLLHGYLLAVASEVHRLVKKESVSLFDLANEQLILYRQGYLARDLVLEVLGAEAEHHIVYSTDNTESARKMIRAGLGICFLPNFMIASWDSCERKGLAILNVEQAPFSLELCCIYATHRYRSRLLANHIKSIVDRM